ncbi:MAG TPA: helix-turn-helix transcriptional regulator [Solirubrobacteraceae bacterium]
MSAHVTRAERLQQILIGKARGLTQREIAAELGIGRSAVNSIICDPAGTKARARKDRYRGVCADCGGPTDGSNGRDKAALRCRWCARGLQPPRRRLTLPVRLCDLSLDARLAGAREAARTWRDPNDRAEILLAALTPSTTVYWLAESARPLLEQLAHATDEVAA